MLRPAAALALAALLLPPAAHAAGPHLPVLANAEAWQRLPGAPATPQPLPAWARMLAGPLPLTTARMLELDALHRTGDRLDARTRALARYACADANKCDYAKAVAAADFARAGGDPADIARLIGDADRLPALDRQAVRFARKMMLKAYAVTDDEVRALVALAGEERVMALVALVAHASFQDRVLLALNADAADDPPPVLARFARPKPPAAPPPGGAAPPPAPPADPAPAESETWDALQGELDKQRRRPGRVRVPTHAEVLKRIGDRHPAAWQSGIVWSRVAYGYQPELTDAWFDTAAAFRQDAKMDSVFQNKVFWVVTDAVRCFY